MLLAFSYITFGQQVTIDNTVSPQDLIENNLIQGCVECLQYCIHSKW